MSYELMGESIKSAIIIQLREIFPTIAIYKEALSIPLLFPHFFVLQVTMNAQEERSNYWWVDYLINIRYRAVDDPIGQIGPANLQEQLDAVGLELLAELDTVKLFGKPRKVKNARYEKIDGVLHYFCNLRISTVKPIPESALQMILELNFKEGMGRDDL